MINLTKKEKDQLGWSLIVGTVFGIMASLYVGHSILQWGYLPLEAASAGFVHFLLISTTATVMVYITISAIDELTNGAFGTFFKRR